MPPDSHVDSSSLAGEHELPAGAAVVCAQEREAFEAHFRPKPEGPSLDLTRTADGTNYKHNLAQSVWLGWQARAASTTISDAPKLIGTIGHVFAARQVQDALPCTVCGAPYAKHGSYPTCATHPYTSDGKCQHVMGAACVGVECVNGCVRAAISTASK